MRRILPVILVSLLAGAPPRARQTNMPGPQPAPLPPAIPAPQDIPYPGGTIQLSVDATQPAQGIMRVHEVIPVAKAGPLILLYPRWLPGNHSPSGPISKLAGLTVHAGGQVVPWKRDPVDVFAFHVDVPNGAREVTADFQYLSPVEDREGRVVSTDVIVNLEWNAVVLYPAGYFSRRIPVRGGCETARGLGHRHGAGRVGGGHFKTTTPQHAGGFADAGGQIFLARRYRSRRQGAGASGHRRRPAGPAQRSRRRNWRRTRIWCSRPTSSTARTITIIMISCWAVRPCGRRGAGASPVQRGRHHREIFHPLGQDQRRPRSAGARIHPFLERQIPPPRRSVDAQL